MTIYLLVWSGILGVAFDGRCKRCSFRAGLKGRFGMLQLGSCRWGFGHTAIFLTGCGMVLVGGGLLSRSWGALRLDNSPLGCSSGLAGTGWSYLRGVRHTRVRGSKVIPFVFDAVTTMLGLKLITSGTHTRNLMLGTTTAPAVITVAASPATAALSWRH